MARQTLDSAGTTMLEFRVLGTTDLRDPSTDQSFTRLIARPKLLALLTYLVLETPRGFQRRDALIGVLWPEHDQRLARHALRQALYELRQLLGENVVVSRGDDVGIDARLLECDAHAFEAAIEEHEDARALELYGGDLLPGLHVPGCREFEYWLDALRQRLRALAVRATRRRALELIANEDFSGAIPHLHRGLVWDPYEEGLLRELIICLHRVDDRSAAIREYELFRSRLSSDLALEPSGEVQALIEAIRKANPDAPGGPVHPLRGSSEAEAELNERAGVDHRRWWVSPGRASALTALVALLAFIGVVANQDRAVDSATFDLESNRVIVLPFANRTGDPSLDRLGRITADWIMRGLVETDLVRVVRIAGQGPVAGDEFENQAEAARSLAESRRTALAIIGSYLREGDSLVFEAQLIDVRTGELLRAIPRVATPDEVALGKLEELRQRVAGSLATVVDPRLRLWADRASQPPTYAAYVLYDRGLEAFFGVRREPFSIEPRSGPRVSGMREAAEHFRRAAAADPDFNIALLWALQSSAFAGQRTAADTLAQELQKRRGRLTKWERTLLDGYLARTRGDLPAAYRAFSRVVEMTPGDVWNYNLAQTAYDLNRPREAMRLLLEAGSEHGLLFHSEMYWGLLARARHRLGDHERELQDVRTWREVLPGDARLRRAELRASGALGRIDGLTPRDQDEAFVLVEELLRHGHDAAATEVITEYLARYDPTRDSLNPSVAAYWLEKAGRIDESKVILEKLVAEDPDNWWAWRRLGEVAATNGARQQAIDISMSFDEWEAPPAERARTTYYRAVLAAYLGDNERAVQLIGQALDQGQGRRVGLDYLHRTPYLPQSLRDYPPFRELMRPEG